MIGLKNKKKYEVDEQLKYLHFVKIKIGRELINKIASDRQFRNRFIFPELKETDFYFASFDVYKPTKLQSKQIEVRTAVYNKVLKELAKNFNFHIKLTTHVARHTYTNSMLSNGADVYDISKSLGHSKLAITEGYLNNFNPKKIDDVNKKLDDMYSF